MPDPSTSCQLPCAERGDSPQKSATNQGTQCPRIAPWAPVSATAMEVDTTAARHSGPRNWLRSVAWLIGAGLHPKGNQTTLAVAQDLAKRMDYSTGHVRYDLEGTADRVGIDRSNVKRHVKYLRQLGALAWAQRGTRRNVHREQGLPGYAATATVYAATIPAAYDHAMGHRIIGTGYGSRIVKDYRQMPDTRHSNTPAEPVDNVSSDPVDNSAKRSFAPPSLTPATNVGQAQMAGGVTATAARSHKIPSTPTTAKTNSGSSKKRATILGATITAAGMHLGDKLARAIRRAAPWTRTATHDQLRWVCADMGEQQWTEAQAVRFVIETGHRHAAGYAWTPDRPHRLIAAALRAADQEPLDDVVPIEIDPDHFVTWENSTAGREAARLAGLADLFAAMQPDPQPEPARTDEDRLRARADWNTWPDVAHHYADDPDDALDLYGVSLCTYAIGQDARTGTSTSTLTHI